ncbi:MAG: hypothetical protein AB1815_11050 [Bacillota bacterium]|jgi:hypothetical protein
MIFQPCGLATGIGSLPFLEPEEALKLIWQYMPGIPHWPQLPRRGGSEGFVNQFLNPLVKAGLLAFEGDSYVFDTTRPDWPDRLTDFYTVYLAAESGDLEALASFAFPPASAAGFYAFMKDIEKNGTRQARYLKGHLAGPLTIGFQLKDRRGRLAYYEDQLRDLLVRTLAMHARWQAATLSGMGLPAIIFVDEPGIGVYGHSMYITVTREMILADLNAIFRAGHTAGGVFGVHSCDAIDWTLLYESELEIVNLDVYQFGPSLLPYARELGAYLERGGVVAWGLAPTSDRAFEEDVDSLLAKISDLWGQLSSRGVDSDRLKRQSLFTPACGAGLLEPDLARRIYELNYQVAEKLMTAQFN